MTRPPKRPRKRKFIAAKMVADGKSQKAVAAELGVSPAAISEAVKSVLNYERFEDVRNCRLIANQRLDSYRVPLLEVAGIDNDVDMENKVDPKKRGEPSSRVAAVRALVDIEKRRADMFGYDAPQRIVTRDEDPLESMSPEEVLAACQSLKLPVPPGLREEVERRAKAGGGPAEAAAGGAEKAGR